MKQEIRYKSYWCLSNNIKHQKCGGRVYTLLRTSEDIKKEFREDNFKFKKCNCYCHDEN
jgi:hypothetical protein